MFSNTRNLLVIKTFLRNSLLNSKNTIRFNLFNKGILIKRFSVHDSHGAEHASGHGHGEGNGHNDHHDDHGHHEITGEVDLEKRSKYISLIGVPNNKKHVNLMLECENKARNQITPISIPLITRSRVYYKDLANVSYEDNPYFHPEPYGYLVSDDPFDPNPSAYQTFYLIAMAVFAFMILTRIFRMNNLGDLKIMSQEIYHAHYTANLIEDEIRKIRKEDYPWRKRYDELKKEKTGDANH